MAESTLVIDTDIIIDFLRRHTDTLFVALSHYQAHLTAITVYELEVSAVRSARQAQQFERLLTWLDILPLDDLAARRAAAIQRELQAERQVIGLPDTLIAGICLSQNMPLLTRNLRHYVRVAGL